MQDRGIKLVSVFLLGVLMLLPSLLSQGMNQDLLIRFASPEREKEIVIGNNTWEVIPLVESRSSLFGNWFLARPKERVDKSAWDLAHEVLDNNPNVLYAEPDYTAIQTYDSESVEEQRGNTGDDCKESAYTNDWDHPQQVIFDWHLQNTHSQLKSARQPEGNGKKIRIAHFDTGYDPNHITTPKYLCTNLQRNFIDGEDAFSAIDIGSEGLLNQPGHGTSTLCILAGNKVSRPQYNFNDYVGAAPFAEIIPVRVSKTVILYKSSSFVKALAYIMEPNVHCDVVSMSMGGVASEAWADAVNLAYDKGITIVTAAGNNLGCKPTTHVVYPARFKRVIAVCGVTYAHTPYFKYGITSFKMQGNYGPASVMTYAIAAYTPNVPWASWGCGTTIDLDGGGTSAATPQIAGAAALWLEKYQNQVYAQPWQRVNAVRHALFSSAAKNFKDSEKFYGNGVLRAANALNVPPRLDSKPIDKDDVSFPIWDVLFGGRDSRHNHLYEVEMLRLEHNSPTIQGITASYEETKTLTEFQKQQLKQAVLSMPEASESIKEKMKEMK